MTFPDEKVPGKASHEVLRAVLRLVSVCRRQRVWRMMMTMMTLRAGLATLSGSPVS